jgi:catechol 2,3-dioxygenase-like lactoylglutathione lyase family enzyme
MLDHIGIEVTDLERSKAFYAAALAPLGYSLAFEFEGGAGFGSGEGIPDFWLHLGEAKSGTHVAFHAQERQVVHAFHEAALAAGGTDDGAPGPRPQYTPTYYAAYVRDPDGHNIEAVCHEAEA